MDKLVMIEESWGDIWKYLTYEDKTRARLNDGWVHTLDVEEALINLKEGEVAPELNTRLQQWFNVKRPKVLEGIEDNNGWITRSLDREYGMLYVVIYKDSGKMGVIELRGPHVIRDGHTFDTQDVLPYISHWRKLDFEKPLI